MISTGHFVVLFASLCIIGVANAQSNANMTAKATRPPSSGPTNTKILGSSHIYVNEGGTIRLQCVQSDGKGVQWEKEKKPISEDATGFYTTSRRKDGKYISVLHKTNATLADSGTYTCRLKDTSENAYSVIVNVIKIESEDFLLDSPEQTAVLRCTMEDSQRGEYTLSWYKNGDKIMDDDEKYDIDMVNNTLSITHIVEADLGPYTCSFKSKEDQYNETVYLNSEPFVKKMDTSKNLVQGDPLNLDCHILVYPNATVSWYKGVSEKLEESERIHITTSELSEHGSIKTVKLRIDQLDFEDRDDYTCVAENLDGTFASNSTILVRVKDKLAALWPFLGICAEVTILCIIIFVYERKRAKKMAEEESAEETGHLTNSHDHKDQKDDIRQRK